ncbi:MAG: cytochrome c3 family protein [Magnetococcus sp. WYHC-3]
MFPKVLRPHRVPALGLAGVLWLVCLALAGQAGATAAAALPIPAGDAGAADRPVVISETNQDCVRCHTMPNLGFRDPDLGERRFTLSPEAFEDSNHKKMDCDECHNPLFQTWPHPPEARKEQLGCLNCHDEYARFRKRFAQVGEEFKESVHYAKLGDKMTCFSCHDPHAFRVARQQQSIADIIAQDNGYCLNCHRSTQRFAALTRRTLPVLEVAHAWLPNLAMHWQKVRCIECHTPHQAETSHRILGARQAERRCVACHSKDSILLTKLYKFSGKGEQGAKAGFANAGLMENAYLIGSTRNDFLDWFSAILLGMTVLGVGGHGVMRFLTSRLRRNKQ